MSLSSAAPRISIGEIQSLGQPLMGHGQVIESANANNSVHLQELAQNSAKSTASLDSFLGAAPTAPAASAPVMAGPGSPGGVA